MILHAIGEPNTEYGKRPILISDSYDCPDCHNTHLLEECPDCGSRDIFYGYGLGYGPGFGQYKVCGDGCGWSWKLTEPY